MREMTIHDAVIVSGVPASTLRRWAAKGEITASKLGKSWVVDIDTVPLDRKGMERLKASLRPKVVTTLRDRIEELIEQYKEARKSSPKMFLSIIIDDLKDALGE